MVPDIARNLAEVRRRIGEACARAGRREEDVTVVAVSKSHPVELIQAARQEGIADFGENRPQELADKARALDGIRWHMIGHIQRNKAALVADIAHLVHSVDSLRLAKALSMRREASGDPMRCLVQVNISGESSKGGFQPSNVLAGIQEIARMPGIRIVGLMGMAALVEDPEDVRGQFAGLRLLAERCSDASISGVEMVHLSMGMSGDYEVAIEEGATLIRVGSAIFEPGS